MADYPKYVWLIENEQLVLLEEDPNERGAYVTPVSDNTDGVLLRYIADYSDPTDLASQVIQNDTLFLALVHYVKYRMFEDQSDIRRAAYHRNEFYRLVSRYRRENRDSIPQIKPHNIDSLR